jgi:hypothetical protein
VADTRSIEDAVDLLRPGLSSAYQCRHLAEALLRPLAYAKKRVERWSGDKFRLPSECFVCLAGKIVGILWCELREPLAGPVPPEQDVGRCVAMGLVEPRGLSGRISRL